MDPESTLIDVLKTIAPLRSISKVTHTWAEHDRFFLILSGIKGSTLQNVWASLSLAQRRSALATIADYRACLA